MASEKQKEVQGAAAPRATRHNHRWCDCGHLDICHSPGRCLGLVPCPEDDWTNCACVLWSQLGSEDPNQEAPLAHAAEPPSVLCTVCMDSGTEFTEEGAQPCTNRIHEEVLDD